MITVHSFRIDRAENRDALRATIYLLDETSLMWVEYFDQSSRETTFQAFDMISHNISYRVSIFWNSREVYIENVGPIRKKFVRNLPAWF